MHQFEVVRDSRRRVLQAMQTTIGQPRDTDVIDLTCANLTRGDFETVHYTFREIRQAQAVRA